MFDTVNWFIAYPEIYLLVFTSLFAILDLFIKPSQHRYTFAMVMALLIGSVILTLCYWMGHYQLSGFSNTIESTSWVNFLKFSASLGMIFVLAYTHFSLKNKLIKTLKEFYLLSLFALIGVFVIISNKHLVGLYLGLELLTLSCYAMVALHRDEMASIESATKYFILGAIASGILLFGLSLIYGATASLNIETIAQTVMQGQLKSGESVLWLGLVFVVAAVAFKLGLIPFHFWIPDVYLGTPNHITLFLASIPKFAAYALIIKLLCIPFLAVGYFWVSVLTCLGLLSIFIGNIAAIGQIFFKRMLAYSTIAQMGFLVLAFVPLHNVMPSQTSQIASLFYIISYIITVITTFGILMTLSNQGFVIEKISDFAGLAKRNSFMAFALAFCLLSFAGIPPMVGFFAKFSVLSSALAISNGYSITVAVLAVLGSLIGAFYYIRIIKIMYFENPVDIQSFETTSCKCLKYLLFLNLIVLVILSIFPSLMFDFIDSSF